MASNVTGVGIIGCGSISYRYFRSCQFFPHVEVRACADLDIERAKDKAEEWNVPQALTPDELLSQPDIDIVVNLTIPQAHAEVNSQIIEAGKHPFSEKPLAVERVDGERVLNQAREKNLRVGCAPDTVLGAGIQTCRKIIDDGWIGTPVAATSFMLGRGPERWHKNPAFYYQKGGGPMFDMGPYYLSALITMLGPVRRITGSTRMTHKERMATGESTYGQILKVEVPTHIAATLDFHAGPVVTLVTSFDVQATNLPNIEIYGTEGTLRVPDPNSFAGPIMIRRTGAEDWSEVPLLHSSTEPGRGIGVAEMAGAMQSGRPHRSNGELAYHVLDLLHAVHESSNEERHITLQSACEQPAPLPIGPIREVVL